MISVKRVLENDLPNELKMSEARKRDAEKAAEQRLTMQNKKKLYYYYRNGDEKTKSEQHEGLGSLNLFLLPLSSPLHIIPSRHRNPLPSSFCQCSCGGGAFRR